MSRLQTLATAYGPIVGIEVAAFVVGFLLMLLRVRRTDGGRLDKRSIRNVALLMLFTAGLTAIAIAIAR
jgi:hypothetical protein